MNIKVKKKLLRIIIALIVLNLGTASLFTVVIAKNRSARQLGSSLTEYADKVLALCHASSYRQGCYDKEIPKLMDVISMEDAFKVTEIVQDKDASYSYCHVLGHELSAREVKKDPDKWKDVIARCPSGVCSNGCIHGGMQERFRSESLTDAQIEKIIPDIEMICEEKPIWHPTGLEQNSCYHALGHLTMYLTNADIDKSVAICDRIAVKPDGRNLAFLCYDGAYMQLFQPLEPEDIALIKGKEVTHATVDGFCNRFHGEKNASCWSESWPLFNEEIKQADGMIALCSHIEDGYQQRCFNSMFYGVPIKIGFDTQKIAAFCEQVPTGYVGTCFANAADRLIETDYRNIQKSTALCGAAKEQTAGAACYDQLVRISTFHFHPDSAEFRLLCNSLPGAWQEACLKQAG